MRTFAIGFISLAALALCGTANALVIESPLATNWGTWQPWVFCPAGMFAHGVKIRVQKDQGPAGDDTGVNNIALLCDYPGSYNEVTAVVIPDAPGNTQGTWGRAILCHGRVTGFQLRVEEPLPGNGDDTATNNIRIFCDDDRDDFLEADGNPLGRWTNARHCDTRQAFVGISVQIEPRVAGDNTSLNNIRVECRNTQD